MPGVPRGKKAARSGRFGGRHHTTDETRDEMVVARVNDDLVAALEYAVEELEEYERPDYIQPIRHGEPAWGKVKVVR